LFNRLIYIRRSWKPVNFEQMLVGISILLMVVYIAHASNHIVTDHKQIVYDMNT
jgi:hypothetical protein